MTYTLKTNKIRNEGDKVFTVYGITAIDEKNRVINSVDDIFVDKVKAERFIELCNKNQLSILHLKDVIDDVISTI